MWGRIAASILVTTMFFNAASGSVVVTLEDIDGNPNSIGNVQPGDTLMLLVHVDSTEPLLVLSFMLRASTPGLFLVDSVEYAPEWAAPSNFGGFDPSGLTLAPSVEVGSYILGMNGVSGPFDFASIALIANISPDIPAGTYTLNLADFVAAIAPDLESIGNVSAGPNYTIYVGSPEPGGGNTGGNPSDGGSPGGGGSPGDGGTNPGDGGTGPDDGQTNPDDSGNNPSDGGGNPDDGNDPDDSDSNGSVNGGGGSGNIAGPSDGDETGSGSGTPNPPTPAVFSLCGAGISQMTALSLLGLLLLPRGRRH